MSKIMKRVLSELLLVGMVLSLVGCNEADVLQGELDGLQAKIESQNEKLVELEKENAELSEKVTELESACGVMRFGKGVRKWLVDESRTYEYCILFKRWKNA